jgi:hypothetical protein
MTSCFVRAWIASIAAFMLAVAYRSTILAALIEPSASAASESARSMKLWMDDPSQFLSDAGASRWIIGRSRTPCLSESEADEKACRDAAQQLAGPLHAVMALRSVDREWLRQRLVADLTAGRFIRDRSVSRVHKPYGDIWSAAILVDASSAQQRSIAVEYSANLRDQRHALVRNIFSMAGMCAAILLIYFVLNAATKGYFRGRLRLGAALSLVVLGCMMVHLYASAG